MKYILLFALGYFTCHTLYSKFVDPETSSIFGASSYLMGCVDASISLNDKDRNVFDKCHKKATVHKKTLDKLFGIVL